MRVEVSRKIFMIFFTMTAFMVVMGSVVYFDLKDLQKANAKLLDVKDFQLHIAKLKSMGSNIYEDYSHAESNILDKSLNRLLGMSGKMDMSGLELNSTLISHIDELPELINNYIRANSELMDRYRKNSDIAKVNAALLARVQRIAKGLPQNARIDSRISSMRVLQKQAYFEHDMHSVKQIKAIADSILLSSHKELESPMRQFILNVEENFFNNLAIKDRQGFLDDTSRHFIGVTNLIILSVSNEIRARQSRLNALTLSIIITTVFTAIFLWFATYAYMMRVLSNLKQAIRSIESGDYDYTTGPEPDDEFGDLCKFMKNMSLTLRDNINQIKDSEIFLQKIIDGIAEPIMLIDKDYHVKLMNRTAMRESINTMDKDIKYCYEVSHHSDKPCTGDHHPCPLNLVRETNDMITVEHIHYTNEDEKRHVEIMASPMLSEHGDFEGIIEACRDITDRKKLEEQLHHSQKMEAIGQLTGGIAHDFNNLLTTIIGYGEFLRHELRDDKKLSEYTEIILSSGEKAANLTRSLLAFSRKQIMDPAPTDLNMIIPELKKLLSRLIGEDIEFRLSICKEPVVINADTGQIQQILMNLTNNACDAMPHGGALSISTNIIMLDSQFVETHAFGKPGKYALITVTDTGIGMDRHTMEQIFEPYFTTKEFGKGTGLGMAVVYGLIKQHDGEVFVYSEPGHGTTFRLYFPLIAHSGQPDVKPQSKQVVGGSELVLVAEDDEDVRQLIVTTLTQYGYKVLEAHNGFEAARLFSANNGAINMVILDVLMPGRNGLETLRHIQLEHPDIKNLFISGYPADVLDRKGLTADGMDFLMKPISPHELVTMVRKILDR